LKKNRFKSEVGASFLEFCITLPLLMLILLGTIDMSRIFASHIAFSDALGTAGRQGAMRTVNCEPNSAALSSLISQHAATFGLYAKNLLLQPTIDVINGERELTLSVDVEFTCVFCPLVGLSSSSLAFRDTRSWPLENQEQCS
jgi:Flp pilus assembly protein TadG